MENGTTDIRLIEHYLEGGLDEAQIEFVRKRLLEDPAFNLLYKREKFLEKGIHYSFLKTKLEQIKAIERSLEANDSKPAGRVISLMSWKPLAAAAGILLVAGSYFIFFQSGSAPVNEKLFTAYYEPFDSPGGGLTRGQEDTVMTWKQKGYLAYDNGRYEEAISLFQNTLKENDDPVVELCQGNAYLSIGQADKAELVFRDILDDHEDLVTQAKWYLSLSYLKQNKLERAKSTLWEISKSSTYGEKARKLLKELD